jgi:hypothetical protein
MDIKRHGSQPSGKGPEDYFTGAVRVELFQAPDPARVGGASVTFEPVARTAWHTQTAVLVWRFLKTGGPDMLRMMNRPHQRHAPTNGHQQTTL